MNTLKLMIQQQNEISSLLIELDSSIQTLNEASKNLQREKSEEALKARQHWERTVQVLQDTLYILSGKLQDISLEGYNLAYKGEL